MSTSPTFSRRTIMAAVDALRLTQHAQIEEFALTMFLECAIPEEGGITPKVTALKRFLIENPDRPGPGGEPIVYELIEHVLVQRLRPRYGNEFPAPEEEIPELANSLEKDGYAIHGNRLVPIIPGQVQIPPIQSELELLLTHYGFHVPKGHLDQALNDFTRGNWAAANGQIRSFFEALLGEMAHKLGAQPGLQGSPAIAYLANLPNPIIDPNLNEWEGSGKAFVPGLWKRLHPQGPHPGLSDHDDCRFRLQIVLIAAAHYLKLFYQQVR